MASDTTPRYQFPFPQLTGQDPSVPVDVEASMLAVEASLGVTDDTANALAVDVNQNQVDITDLQAAGGDFPAGIINIYAGQVAPPGWLLCDGSSKSTTAYADLFAAIGYLYGGSGSSFNLPNLNSRIPLGFEQGQSTVGEKKGANTHAISQAEMPTHQHTIGHSHSSWADANGNHQHHQGGYVSVSLLTSGSGMGNDWQILNPSRALYTSHAGDHSHTIHTGGSDTGSSGWVGGNTPMDMIPASVVMQYLIRH